MNKKICTSRTKNNNMIKRIKPFGSKNENHLRQQSLVSGRINFLGLNDYTKRINKQGLRLQKPCEKNNQTNKQGPKYNNL